MMPSLEAVLPDLASAALDERFLSHCTRAPEVAVAPSSVDEVSAVVKWAGREGLGVLPLGSGAWTAPVRDDQPWVALSTASLTGISEYEAADLTVTAGVGTKVGEIASRLASNAQWLPFDPPDFHARSLGGSIGSGASGTLATGYGSMRNHVLGITVVTGDGRVLRLGGRVVKNVAGFDLVRPMVGSHGGLAIMTSATVRAFPIPEADLHLVKRAASLSDLVPLARAVCTAPVLPVSIALLRDGADGSPALMCRLHGAPDTVDADALTIATHAKTDFVREEYAGTDAVHDAIGRSAYVLEASVPPARLDVAEASLTSIQPGPVLIDVYRAQLWIGVDHADASALKTWMRSVEELGGSARLLRWGAGAVAHVADDVRASGSRPTEALRQLTERVYSTFDPEGVLWPGRV